jgi:hypothetical protein
MKQGLRMKSTIAVLLVGVGITFFSGSNPSLTCGAVCKTPENQSVAVNELAADLDHIFATNEENATTVATGASFYKGINNGG